MTNDEFRKYGHSLIDRIAEYFNDIENYPVKSQAQPGEIFRQLPNEPPQQHESFDEIMSDFEDIIMPGMTHWQHPGFFAYFPANNSFPSILAEMLTSALAAQCMIWQTSPAAAELEEKTMNWLRNMIGISDNFTGVIQDTASTSTLVSILTAREKYSDYRINNSGLIGYYQENINNTRHEPGNESEIKMVGTINVEKSNSKFNNYNSKLPFHVYCSTETHTSIEKAVKISGIGKNNLIKIPVDEKFSMRVDLLEEAIINDIENNYIPLCVVGTLGTTGSTGIDPLEEIGKLCRKYNIWYHIDAAFAGTAMILPDYKYLAKGVDYADTFVFNPHKWMFTNFDCSAYFVKDKEALIRTFEILPEYLKTSADSYVNNYRDWGIQLGRRFRALKLWFVIRSFGVEGLQNKIREHIRLAHLAQELIESRADFELMAPVNFNLICFRYKPDGGNNTDALNNLNSEMLDKLNSTGKVFFTHTKLNGNFVIRWVIGQTNVEERHVKEVWELIRSVVK